MEKSVNGHCPHINDENFITVNYKKVSILGDFNDNYKKIDFNCECGDECPYGNNNECPIYDKAPNSL